MTAQRDIDSTYQFPLLTTMPRESWVRRFRRDTVDAVCVVALYLGLAVYIYGLLMLVSWITQAMAW